MYHLLGNWTILLSSHTLYLCLRCVADIATAFLTQPTGWSWWVLRRRLDWSVSIVQLTAGTVRGNAAEAGQLGEAWGPSVKSHCSEIEGHKKDKCSSLFTLTEFLLPATNAAHQKYFALKFIRLFFCKLLLFIVSRMWTWRYDFSSLSSRISYQCYQKE